MGSDVHNRASGYILTFIEVAWQQCLALAGGQVLVSRVAVAANPTRPIRAPAAPVHRVRPSPHRFHPARHSILLAASSPTPASRLCAIRGWQGPEGT